MDAIVLFRFHTDFELCCERIKLIRHLNPLLPIYALYGGQANDLATATRRLAPLLDGIWSIPRQNNRWKWLHQDLAVKEWYEKYGRILNFQLAYDYEYDLVLTIPLSSVGSESVGRSVSFSGIKPLSEVRQRWYWTSVEPYATGFKRYAHFMAERFGLERQTYVTQGPFPVLPRGFLEALCRQDYPEDVFAWVNCETSYPGLAEALGFRIVDTGLHPGWTAGIPTTPVCRLFHCERTPLVSVDDILSELSDPSGRRAFHPVKEIVNSDVIARAILR